MGTDGVMYSWADITTMLTLSISLNFGLISLVTLIQQSMFPEETNLNKFEGEYKSMNSEINDYKNNENHNTSIVSDYQSGQQLIIESRSTIKKISRQIDESFTILGSIALACGMLAIILIFVGFLNDQIVNEAGMTPEWYFWLSFATNFGWFIYLVLVVVAQARLKYQVSANNRKLSNLLVELGNSNDLHKFRSSQA